MTERELTEHRYAEPRNLAIQLWENGEPYAMLSCNLEGVTVPADCFIAKEYSENRGLCDAYLADGTFEDTGETVSNEFVTCRVLRYIRPF